MFVLLALPVVGTWNSTDTTIVMQEAVRCWDLDFNTKDSMGEDYIKRDTFVELLLCQHHYLLKMQNFDSLLVTMRQGADVSSEKTSSCG